MKLKYFKIETFGAVDGPGVRLLAFAQGCPYKCIYCHNPESQTCNGNKYISVSKIIKTYQKHKNFYTNGGITISGGEPLLQKNFCLSIAKRCYRKGISLAFDTSAATFSDANLKFFKKLIKYKPLFLIDIKSMDINMHKKITGSSNLNELALINFLESNKCHYWIRYVVLKGYTDSNNNIRMLKTFYLSLKYCDKIDFLPFHNLAKAKYENLKMKYKLANFEETSNIELESFIKKFNKK